MRYLVMATTIFVAFSGVAACADVPKNDKGEESRALVAAVDKEEARAGETVVATGVFLGKKYVAEVYLTNNKDDISLEIVNQTDKEIAFKVPAGIVGRYRLMILTKEVDPKLVEQPVRLMVLAASGS